MAAQEPGRDVRDARMSSGARPWNGICSVMPPQPSFIVPMRLNLGVSWRSSSQVLESSARPATSRHAPDPRSEAGLVVLQVCQLGTASRTHQRLAVSRGAEIEYVLAGLTDLALDDQDLAVADALEHLLVDGVERALVDQASARALCRRVSAVTGSADALVTELKRSTASTQR